MGTTLDEPLYYVNSTCILARTSLHFYLSFTLSLAACQVFGAAAKEKFSVDISNSAIDSTLDQFYFFSFFLLINQFIIICFSYFTLFHLCCDLVLTLNL